MPEVVQLTEAGLAIGHRTVPLLSGEVHFWRLDPAAWPDVLDRVVEIGLPLVATYLSWRRHETAPGVFDWGETDPALDARRFITLCAERGLSVHLKPGPWICAEEPGGGYPDWLTAHTAAMALDHAGQVVYGFDQPFLHPTPCYRTDWYQQAAQRWLAAVWHQLRHLVYPNGPIVAIQLDNEPSFAFQDAAYFADYHSASVAAFRTWLADRYRHDAAAWRAAWGLGSGGGTAGFEEAGPPQPGAARRQLDDWARFQEDSLIDHLAWLWSIHKACGVEAALPTVNLIPDPLHEMPLRHGRVRERLGERLAAGVDHYYEPPLAWAPIGILARAAATARAAGEPLVWAPEMMAGIWRTPGQAVEYPDPQPAEEAAYWGLALALGHHGFNWYMLADRENWQFAPISADGRATGFAAPLAKLIALLQVEPAILRGRPVAPVAVYWPRGDALDAYSVSGTMRQPDVPWADPARRAAFDARVALTDALLEAGLVFELWDPEVTPQPPDGVSCVLTIDGDNAAPAPARPVGEGLPEPPVRLTGAPAGWQALAVLHTTPEGKWLVYLVQWGDTAAWDALPGHLMLEAHPGVLPAGGHWVDPLTDDALPAAGPLAWSVEAGPGHRVLTWHS
jgi:hypothetical protein